MKRILLLIPPLFALTLFMGISAAAGRGGFTGPGLALSTAEKAGEMRDDSPVALRGNIVRHLGGEKYEFRDASGVIIVAIDDDAWRGITVRPSDTVEIRGEVDRDRRGVTIDVDSLVIVR